MQLIQICVVIGCRSPDAKEIKACSISFLPLGHRKFICRFEQQASSNQAVAARANSCSCWVRNLPFFNLWLSMEHHQLSVPMLHFSLRHILWARINMRSSHSVEYGLFITWVWTQLHAVVSRTLYHWAIPLLCVSYHWATELLLLCWICFSWS